MSDDATKAFDTYDRQIGALKGLPDVIEVKPSTLMREIVFNRLNMKHSTYEQPLPQKLWPQAAAGH